MSKSTII